MTFVDSIVNQNRMKGDAIDRAATSQKLTMNTPPNLVATENSQRTSSAYAGFYRKQEFLRSLKIAQSTNISAKHAAPAI